MEAGLSTQPAQADERAHHHKGDRQGGDATDVPGQATEVGVCEVGDQPQADMHDHQQREHSHLNEGAAASTMKPGRAV